MPDGTLIFQNSAGTPIFRPALKNLILVPGGTRILKHSADRHYVPRPLSAQFLFFSSTWNRLCIAFSTHYDSPWGVGKCRENLERNRESFQECFEQNNSLKQTLLFKVLKLLKVEKSFRFNSSFIIFETKTWKIFALKLS